MQNPFEMGINAMAGKVENAPVLKALETVTDAIPGVGEAEPAVETPEEAEAQIENTKEDLDQLYDEQEG